MNLGNDENPAEIEDDRFAASRQLGYHHKERPIRDILSELAEAADPDLKPGHYGEGEVVERLERRIAA